MRERESESEQQTDTEKEIKTERYHSCPQFIVVHNLTKSFTL